MVLANIGDIKMSALYIGYHILKEIQKKESKQISIYDVAKALKKQGIKNSRQIVLGLSFLYSLNIIDFDEAMIWVVQ